MGFGRGSIALGVFPTPLGNADKSKVTFSLKFLRWNGNTWFCATQKKQNKKNPLHVPNLIPKVNQLLELCFYRKCLSGNFNRKPIILMLFVKLLKVLLSRKKRDPFHPQSSRENKILIIYENSFCGGRGLRKSKWLQQTSEVPLWCLTTTQPQTAGGATLTEPTQAQHWIQPLKVEGFWFPFNIPHAESQHYPLTTTTKKDAYSISNFHLDSIFYI